MEAIEGFSENRHSELAAFLESKKLGAIIPDPPVGGYSSIWSATDKCRELCKKAHATYTFHSTPLFFVPVASKKRNAYAVTMPGFDVILITDSLIKSIDEFSFFLSRYTELILVKSAPAASAKTPRISSFSVLHNLPGNLRDQVNQLRWIVRDSVLAFLIGHELGHLAGGHISVLTHYKKAMGENAGEGGLEWDEQAAASMQAGPADLDSSTVLVAHEVDADIQGMRFLASHWCDIVKLGDESAELRTVARALLATPPQRYFLSLVSICIAQLLLGLAPFSGAWNRQATHPLGSTRILIAIITMSNFFPKAKGDELVMNQAVEACMLVHAAWGQSLLQFQPSETAGISYKYTNYDDSVHRLLRKKIPGRRHSYLLSSTGLRAMVQAHSEIRDFLDTLSKAYQKEEYLRSPTRRVRKEFSVAW